MNDTTSLPLNSIRCVDFTVGGSGPFATLMLTDLGAEVIRIDDLKHPDINTRGPVAMPQGALRGAVGAHFPDEIASSRPYERYTMFNYSGRGRLSATFALEVPRMRELLLELLDTSDVLIINRAPGSLARLGLDVEELRSRNPRLIIVEMTAFGSTPGPYRDYRGYGANMEAIGGHTSMRGYPDLDLTGVTTIVHADAVGGSSGMLAVTMALVQRERTGRGDYIDLSQTEALIPQLAPAISDYTLNGRVAGPTGNRDPFAVQGVYRCTGEDAWLAVTIRDDAEWERLCQVMERPDLITDPRFEDHPARRDHHDAFDALLAEWCAPRDQYSAFHELQAGGVTAGPILTMIQAFSEPHHRERGFLESITYPYTGPVADGAAGPGTHDYAGPLFDMEGSPIRARGSAPSLGEHNAYVFKTLLGVGDAEYDAFREAGLIGDTYPTALPARRPETEVKAGSSGED